MDIVLSIIQSILPGLIVALVMASYNRRQKSNDDAVRSHEEQRIEAENVQVSLLVATAKLSYALAMAAKRGTPNGEVEEGIEQYKEAMKSFKQFERNLVAKSGTE